jgi:lysophospholipase L1-like esterase
MKSRIRTISYFLFLCGLIVNPAVIEYLAFGTELSNSSTNYVFIFEFSIILFAILLYIVSSKRVSTANKRTLINFTLIYGSILVPLYGFIGIETLGVIAKYTLLDSTPEDKAANDIFRSPVFRESRYLDDKSFQSEYVKTNTQGFRSLPFIATRERNKSFIFLGGSTAWGWNVADQHTIPEFLQSRINDDGIDIDAYNLAQNGSNISDQFSYLDQYVDIIKPKFIILYNGINEYAPRPRQRIPIVNASNGFNLRPKNIILKARKFAYSLYRDYFTFQLIFSLGSMLVDKNEVQNDMPNYVEERVEAYIRHHKAYEELCIKNELTCYTFFQPILLNKKEKTVLESIFYYSRHYFHDDKYYNNFVSKVLEKIQLNSSVKIIDIRNAFSKIKIGVFFDYCHVNFQGNKIIADTIFGTLKDDI